jgi:hypothetical protein
VQDDKEGKDKINQWQDCNKQVILNNIRCTSDTLQAALEKQQPETALAWHQQQQWQEGHRSRQWLEKASSPSGDITCGRKLASQLAVSMPQAQGQAVAAGDAAAHVPP